MPGSRRSSPDRFAEFAATYCGLMLEPFQRRIAAEAFSGRRELLCLLPRGNGKTTLFAALGLWELLTTRDPAIYVAAASREQARLLFETAKRMVLAHPELDRRITSRHAELRTRDGFLRVIASDAPPQHGLTPSLALVDELHAHRDGELYLALRTAMLKRPGARMATISTAGSTRQWRKLPAAILARDGHRCRRCGRPATHADHIIPVSRGGRDDPANLQALCARCNLDKGSDPA